MLIKYPIEYSVDEIAALTIVLNMMYRNKEALDENLLDVLSQFTQEILAQYTRETGINPYDYLDAEEEEILPDTNHLKLLD